MNVGVFGATGQVGTVMRRLLAEREFPVSDIRFFASARSAGTSLPWRDRTVVVDDAATAEFSGLDLALLSIGADASREVTPRLVASGVWVVDNSSAFRMAPDVPLVVTEVNAAAIKTAARRIVANPNCTTMAAMPALAVLHRAAGLRAVTAATYQAAGGAGREGVEELASQLAATRDADLRALAFDPHAVVRPWGTKFPAPLAHNVIPLAGHLVDDGSGESNEEQKFRLESRKILDIPDLAVSITCVRVPVFTGHALAITASFAEPLDPARATDLLSAAEGVAVVPLPTPLAVTGEDVSLVGRIRRAESVPNGLSFFVVGDNLRKGAALNAVQIAEAIAQLA